MIPGAYTCEPLNTADPHVASTRTSFERFNKSNFTDSSQLCTVTISDKWGNVVIVGTRFSYS